MTLKSLSLSEITFYMSQVWTNSSRCTQYRYCAVWLVVGAIIFARSPLVHNKFPPGTKKQVFLSENVPWTAEGIFSRLVHKKNQKILTNIQQGSWVCPLKFHVETDNIGLPLQKRESRILKPIIWSVLWIGPFTFSQEGLLKHSAKNLPFQKRLQIEPFQKARTKNHFKNTCNLHKFTWSSKTVGLLEFWRSKEVLRSSLSFSLWSGP